ncbi:ATP-dependent helicase [Serinicoccus profundi]|uniref:ATP-dependent helicase n=1 Tax=Serinicoccus profundi TaxID=1078471 RepID=UPI000255EC3F|nr:ATP-dependent DNA helicase [Serinicoccus profundi]
MPLLAQPRHGDAVDDPDQRSAIEHRGGVLLVLGAPGTGRTSVLIQHVQARLRQGLAPDRCLVIAPTRQAAGRLRAAVGHGLQATHTEPLARTAASLAFSVLRIAAARDGEPLPRLISGAEQDAVLRELLAGHEASGTGPRWPVELDQARRTDGFRGQLRDLLMRAVEHGVGREDLELLAQRHDRPEWACAGELLEEYDQVTALSEPGSYDPAWICTAAADALEVDDELRSLVHARVGFVAVDDAQELTASAARLLDAVRGPGTDALLAGDPDAAVLGFRGAVPGRFLELAERWSGTDRPSTITLRTRHGVSAAVGAVADRVAERIGVVGGAGHRRPAAGPAAGAAWVRLTRGAAQEAALVARWLRHAHLIDGVPWQELAVVARSRAQQETIRRALSSGGVPVRVDRSSVPLGSDPAVAPLLLALDVVTRGADDDPKWSVGPDDAVELVSSPLGGLDPVGLRRLRRRLRAQELADGGRRGADELLALRLSDPDLRRQAADEVASELEPLRRVALVLQAGRDVVVDEPAVGPHLESPTAGQGASGPDAILWALWSQSGLARSWARQALAGGALGARADRDLDAVLVLFAAAEAHVERRPGSRARSFLDSVRGATVAADTLVVGAQRTEAVEILTPHAAAGRRWSRVAVVGVQEGVWPDLRLRDTLLGAQALVAAIEGRPVSGTQAWRQAQAAVRSDELRQFHLAVTRARDELLVTATSSTDDQPSGLLDLVDPDFRDHPPVDVPAPMTLRGVAGELRRAAVQAQRQGDLRTRDAALDQLLRLADEGVPGADPLRWWDLRDVSSAAALRPQGPVRVSPSRLQTFLDCELRWFLTSRGAETGEAAGAALGTLVHEVVAESPDAPVADLVAELDRRWPDLGLVDGWVSDRRRADAHRMVERYTSYVRDARDAGRELVGVELDLSVSLPAGEGEGSREARLAGAVDRLERDADGGLVVADLKTGSTPVPRADVARHAQLAAYQVAVTHGAFPDLGTTSAGARLVQLGTSGSVEQAQEPLTDSEDLDWALTTIQQAASGMAGAQFTATDLARRCRRCPARFACPLQPEGSQR